MLQQKKRESYEDPKGSLAIIKIGFMSLENYLHDNLCLREPELFNQIYSAAKKIDTQLLESIFKDNYTLDVDCNGFTPSAKLASEGNLIALNCLKKFPISNSWIAFGFAYGGYTKEAVKYAMEQDVNIDLVARGFAKGGYIEAALFCVDKFNAKIDEVAQGFAYSGYLESAIDCVDNRGATLTKVIVGLIEGRYFSEIAELFNKGVIDHGEIVSAFARIGGYADALVYVTEKGVDINWLAQGFGLAGYLDAGLACVAKCGASIDWVASALAKSGYIAASLQCVDKHGAYIDDVTFALAQAGYTQIAMVECIEKRGADIHMLLRGLASGSYNLAEKSLLKISQFCCSDANRVKLINAHVALTHFSPKFEKSRLSVISNKLAFLKEKRHMNFDLAYIWLNEPNLRNFLLNVRSLNYFTRNRNCFELIIKRLCALPLTSQRVEELHDAAVFHVLDKSIILEDLNNYLGTGLGTVVAFFKNNSREKAKKLLDSCKATQCKSDLIKLLKSYLADESNPGPFQTLLKRHLDRVDYSDTVERFRLEFW